MKEYPNGYFITLSDCADKGKENAYNEWYNKVMVPEVQKLDFVGEARRYTNVLPETIYGGHPKYLALYDLWTEDLSKAIDEIQTQCAKIKTFPGHATVYDTVYERFCAPKVDEARMARGTVQGMYVVFCFCNDPLQEKMFNRWYNGTHVIQILDAGGWNSGLRCRLVDSDKQAHHQPEYLSLYETTGDPLEARNIMIKQRSELMKDIVWMDMLGVYFTGAYKHLFTSEV